MIGIDREAFVKMIDHTELRANAGASRLGMSASVAVVEGLASFDFDAPDPQDGEVRNK